MRKAHITLQSSLHWSAADAPAINPTQALSHFRGLMREKYETGGKKDRENQEYVYSREQPMKSYVSGSDIFALIQQL